MDRFACRTQVISGTGVWEVLAQKSFRRLLVAAEPRLAGAEAVRRIVKAAKASHWELLLDVDPEPTMQQAVDASRKLREFGPDLVVALGGRNVMDWAKAMVCFSRHSCELVMVPAVFGAGSEMTGRVTLTHNGRRHLLRDRAMCPDMVILDPELQGPVQKASVSEGGFELLAAALEAYTGEQGSFLRLIHAREAFASGVAALPAAFAGNGTALERMRMASVLTGLAAEETGLGLCRAMENSLGTVFGLSRGKAAAILLPAIIGCNAHGAGRRYAELSRVAGMGGSREEIGVRNLRTGLARLRRELGLPGTLVQAGVDIRSVWNNGRRVVELTLEDPECRNNPVAVDDFMVRRILEEITGRI